jgi:ABC-2 type transport system ATP-binding protein
MLVVSGLRKSYRGTPALDGFDLTVAAGEIVGLIGHNGAGKSTFVSVVSGLVRPDGGGVTIAGTPTVRAAGDRRGSIRSRERAAARMIRTQVGVAPQILGLYPTATVRENLGLFGGLAGLRGRAQARAVAEVADELVLTDLLERRVRELSGGQQRRVQAGTALVHRPPLLLLDEPTVGADPVTREAILGAVRRQAEAGAAVVYTTHYLPELDGLAASLAVVRAGQVVARGSRAELLAGLPGSLAASYPGGREVTIAASDPGAALAQLLADGGELPERVDLRSPSLDDLYRALAGSTR